MERMLKYKQGQGLSITTMILLALGIAVMVVVILGVTQGFGIFTQYFDKVDTIEKEALAQVCGGIASLSDSACNTKYELSNNRYVTCSYAVQNLGVIFDGASDLEKCDMTNDAKSVCVFEKAKVGEEKFAKSKMIVNGVKCLDILSGVKVVLGLDSSSGDATESSGSGVIEIDDEFFENIESQIEFKGSKNFNVLTDEECKKTLTERRMELNIPDKLCYWEYMKELYDKKCDNLDNNQISDIFKSKAEYRAAMEDKSWNELNLDENLCAEVVYDCDTWITKISSDRENPYGVLRVDMGKFFINPYLDFEKDFLQGIVIHESLHSIQKNIQGSFFNIFDFSRMETTDKTLEIYPELKETYANIETIFNNLKKSYDAQALQFRKLAKEKLKECKKTKAYMVCFNEMTVFVKTYSKEGRDIRKMLRKKSIGISNLMLSEDNLWHNFYHVDDNNFRKNLSILKSFSETKEFKDIINKRTVFGYTSLFYELDPRLSEVNRWLLDKTSPDCEIITDPIRAKKVLSVFLLQEDVGDEYSLTQEQLKEIMEVAKRMGREEEIYNKLANRIPGLAYNEELGDGMTAYV